jgi:hypothetical protein
MDLAAQLHWSVYHTRYSIGSTAGFPDLVLVRERVIYAELKRETGKPTGNQLVWLDILHNARQEVYLWRPSDLMDIAITLQRHQPPDTYIAVENGILQGLRKLRGEQL